MRSALPFNFRAILTRGVGLHAGERDRISGRPFRRFVMTGIVGLIAYCSSVTVRAELATEDETLRVAENWVRLVLDQRGTWARSAAPEIISMQPLVGSTGQLAHVWNVWPHGYVVVPVLKELSPIRAFSDTSDLDATADGGMAELLREVLDHRLRMYLDRYGSLDAQQPPEQTIFPPADRKSWDIYAADATVFERLVRSGQLRSREQLGPLLDSSWHQGAPYSNYCPWGDGARCVVGCVATATAQAMWYYQWPPNGTDSHQYYWYGDDSCGGNTSGSMLSADYSDSYDWANMPASCGTGSPSAQQAAVAELCFETGVAFEMDYGACGSGAYTANAVNVLPTYFRYDSGIDRENRDQHSASDWYELLKGELNAQRVMIYRISSHAIVCDGYFELPPSIQMYHMNYGWDDSHNAWYNLDDLHCDWSGCDPMVEYVIRRILPDVDCNGNGNLDFDDIVQGISADCNGNRVPDECDLASGTSLDCNGNSIPDECDILIADGGFCDPNDPNAVCDTDTNGNGVPDGCEAPVPCPGDTNCNGQIDFGDINSFVAALVDGTYCDTTGANADVNENGSVGFEDINPFVEKLTTLPVPISCP